jgi:hypothetical protein
VLPSNVEDPRFQTDRNASRERLVDAEWTARSALEADVTQPADDLLLAARSPAGAIGLACWALDLLGALLAAVIRHGSGV